MLKDFLFFLDKPIKDTILERMEKEPVVNKYWNLFAASILLLLLTSILAWFQILKFALPPPAEVFQIHGQEVKQVRTLTFPHQSFKNVAVWLEKAIQASYSLSFDKYQEQINGAEYYFTAEGYTSYLNSLKANGVIDKLEHSKIEISIVPTKSPIFVNSGVVGDTEWWRFRTPVMVSYYAGDKPFVAKYSIDILAVRVPAYLNYRGMAIAEFNMSADN
jgi:intracellular multiplication protein IcmL